MMSIREYNLFSPMNSMQLSNFSPGKNCTLYIMCIASLLPIVDVNAPKYHKLDRGKEGSKAKASAPWHQQKGRPEDYSLLTID